MITISEDYVSFEIAKLLKEKGFDEPTIGTYYKDGAFEYLSLNKWNSKFVTPISAPTLQMVMKWLREVHNLHIIVFHYDNSAFPYIWYIFAHNGDKPHKANSYEQACEAAIKYCLENLI